MYEISSYYDRDFLIHEIFISWRFHDPYFQPTEKPIRSKNLLIQPWIILTFLLAAIKLM